MWQEYISATSIAEVLQVLAERGEKARIVAGATDLILEMERGARKGIETLIDVTRIPGTDTITQDGDGWIHLGPMVTHNDCVASSLIRERAFLLARAAWEVGSPQIRNRGTVAGNLITASPANDTITPLMALDARLMLRSVRGEREVPLAEFYSGVRRTVIQPDEMLVDIRFRAMTVDQHGGYMKFALRRAQAISLVNVAVILELDGNLVREAKITLGAVAPTIVHAREAEQALLGQPLSEEVMAAAAVAAVKAARPISDVRGSAGYRNTMVRVTTLRALRALASGQEQAGFPVQPVLLLSPVPVQAIADQAVVHRHGEPIVTRINGREINLHGGQHKSLLRLLREDAGLVGSKEGCAEGECGACTVFLDGKAVMSCMVPAPRAHGADIVTVEGLAQDGLLHPVQEAYIEAGAVQCGYCIPGFLMSTVKLLEERPTPSQDEIRQALTGNLCRCTGYYKIIEAVERAARKQTPAEVA
jgi:xanthine dehydrogenase iron-sulfur cluster and FAD-binding subunit A